MSETELRVSRIAVLPRRHVLRRGGLAIAFLWTGMRPLHALAEASARPQPGDAETARADGNPAFAPNAFIRIDRSGPVRLVMPGVEMGQGVYMAQAMLLAEELQVGLDQVALEHAPANDALYALPLLKEQVTGGSTTIRSTWNVLREAGAVGRTMLVAAAARQWKVDAASCEAQRGVVTHAPSGRALAYGALADAASREPVPDKVALKEPRSFQVLGKPLRRLDNPGKVDGSTRFGIDVQLPNMGIATVAACPTFGGKLGTLQDGAARAIAGVRDVVRLADAVAVVGDHMWAAKQGLQALEIGWDRGPNAAMSTESLFSDLESDSKHGRAIVASHEGDPQGATGTSVESTYELPFLAHATMEPMNATVHVRPDGCEIWVGTQVPARAKAAAVKITGLPADSVVVHNHYIGGGFGRRLETDFIEQAVAIAKQLSYPVKVIWTREEDVQHDAYRPAYYDRIAARLGGDGLPVSWIHRTTGAAKTARFQPAGMRKDGLDPDAVENAAEIPYAVPNFHVEWVRSDPPPEFPIGWWRGVGPVHNVFVVESFIDELAHQAGKDPFEYRRALLQKNPRSRNVLELAADKFRWGAALPSRSGRGIALSEAFGSRCCAMLEVAVLPQGVVVLKRAVVAVDCGLSVNPNTIEAQIQGGLIFGWSGAFYNAVSIAGGAVEQSNFNDLRVLRIDETPSIEVHHVRNTEAPGGIGEVGTVVAAPCLTNAIFAATGVRLRKLPVDRNRLIENGADRRTASALASDGARR